VGAPAVAAPAASRRGSFPLVVLSPGFGAAAWIHLPVAARLAGHGIVVAVPYHAGDQFWPWEPPYDHVAVASYSRPRDVSFVLDGLLARNSAPGNVLAGTMRPDQVVASGWSLGGYAAITLVGATRS
jgi:predicted dienelactone hydrolase